MFVFQFFWQAHVTFLTMEEIFLSSNPADSTPVTVVLLLVFIVNQLTLATEILKEQLRVSLAFRPQQTKSLRTYLSKENSTI